MKKLIFSILLCSSVVSLHAEGDIQSDFKRSRQNAKIMIEEGFHQMEADPQIVLSSLLSNNEIIELLDGLHEDEKKNIEAVTENLLSFLILYPCDGDEICQQYYISRMAKVIANAEQAIDESSGINKRLIDYIKQRVENVQSQIQEKVSIKTTVEAEEITSDEFTGQQ